MIGRRDYYGLNIFVVEQLPEIAVSFSVPATRRNALLQARLVDIGHSREVGVVLVLEIAHVLAANQAVSDEPHLHAIICACDACVGGRAECCEESTTGGRIRFSYAHSIREYH